jgi:hypothetical protein
MESWTIALTPPETSPRMISPASSTMSEAFSTAWVAMSRAALKASLGVRAIRVSCR